jgi:hypothetical protein
MFVDVIAAGNDIDERFAHHQDAGVVFVTG